VSSSAALAFRTLSAAVGVDMRSSLVACATPHQGHVDPGRGAVRRTA
jgi:hypothetical protein